MQYAKQYIRHQYNDKLLCISSRQAGSIFDISLQILVFSKMKLTFELYLVNAEGEDVHRATQESAAGKTRAHCSDVASQLLQWMQKICSVPLLRRQASTVMLLTQQGNILRKPRRLALRVTANLCCRWCPWLEMALVHCFMSAL